MRLYKGRRENKTTGPCEDFVLTLHEMGLSEQRSDKSNLHCNTIPFTEM